jgi:hypothetical protein
MIVRKIAFDVVYQSGAGGKWSRERVIGLTFATDGSGYDIAKTATHDEVQLHPLYTALLQFTGEFDKTMKPVFHGDILATDDGTLFEAIFANGAFMLHEHGTENMIMCNPDTTIDKKVVGDTFLNPELLMPVETPKVLTDAAQRAAGDETPFVDLKL